MTLALVFWRLPIITPGIETVVKGQVLVNPANGTGYIIQGVIGINATTLAIQIHLALRFQNQFSLASFQNFNITRRASSTPSIKKRIRLDATRMATCKI